MAKRASPGDLLKFVNETVLVCESDECLIWPYGKNPRGYGALKYKGRPGGAHRFICKFAHGEPPTKTHQAAHSCGNTGCVNPRHLSWKTRVENELDKLGHGTKGLKLSESDVLNILSMKGVKPQHEIAKIFGISRSQVSHIHSGRNWSSVSLEVWLPTWRSKRSHLLCPPPSQG